MRFGLFIPQGWRHDLVGIDPAEQWTVMNSLAQHADAGAWESIWVYDHFHTVPVPSEEATHEAWTLMAAFAATISFAVLLIAVSIIGAVFVGTFLPIFLMGPKMMQSGI